MTKHLLAIGLMLIALPHVLRSQSFEFHSNNPFGIQIIGEEGQLPPLMYMFHDMDNDSDVDLIMAGIDSFDLTEGLSVTFFLDYQLNLGTSSEPMFGPRQSFEDFKYPSFIFLPTAGDLNNDGRIDIVAGLE